MVDPITVQTAKKNTSEIYGGNHTANYKGCEHYKFRYNTQRTPLISTNINIYIYIYIYIYIHTETT